jgi:hypothetical protein
MKPTAAEAERARSCRYVVYEDEYRPRRGRDERYDPRK